MKKLALILLLLPAFVQAQQDTDAGPAVVHSAITPHDTDTLTNANGSLRCRAVYVGGAGNITMRDVDDTSVVWTAVPVGTIIPFGPRRVMATGTTATALVCIGR